MSKKYTTVDEFISQYTGDIRTRLEHTRDAIRRAVPDATEIISYNVPAYRKNDVTFIYFSGYTSHTSIACAPTDKVYKKFENELAPYKKSKSTVQFPLNMPLPTELISEIALFKSTS